MGNSFGRRRFLESSVLLALLPYFGKAQAQEVLPSDFGPDATAEELRAGTDMVGRTVVVTGCNSGIG